MEQAIMGEAQSFLVRRALRGDRGAFSDLVVSHWTPLVRLARSVVGDADAEDAVQDGLVAAWRRLSSLREPSAFSSWLSRVILRVCFKRVRRRRPWLPLDDAPEPEAVTDPGGAVDVERMLGALAPRQRAVMHLTVIEGMSDSEIARVLGISAAGVRAHRRRARESLGHLLNGANPS